LGLGKKAKLANAILLFLFSQPAVNSKIIMNKFKITFNTANSLLNDLESLKILQEVTGFSRNRLFIAKAYLNLFKK
jgi:Fic family protein